MIKSTWKVKNFSQKAHFSESWLLTPTIKTRPDKIEWAGRLSSELNLNWQAANSQNTSYVTHTLLIPSIVTSSVFLTTEGCTILFHSGRGDIQFLIPTQFYSTAEESSVTLVCPSKENYAEFRALLGALYRTLLGVTKGYQEKLKTVGVGYKGALKSNRLFQMTLGYSHSVHLPLHSTIGIQFSRKNNRFNLLGPNPLIISQTAADLYSFKEPDVYKGKGIRYRGVKLIKKEGKKKK